MDTTHNPTDPASFPPLKLKRSQCRRMARLMKRCHTDSERMIVRCRIKFGMTPEQIAQALQLPTAMVRDMIAATERRILHERNKARDVRTRHQEKRRDQLRAKALSKP